MHLSLVVGTKDRIFRRLRTGNHPPSTQSAMGMDSSGARIVLALHCTYKGTYFTRISCDFTRKCCAERVVPRSPIVSKGPLTLTTICAYHGGIRTCSLFAPLRSIDTRIAIPWHWRIDIDVYRIAILVKSFIATIT